MGVPLEPKSACKEGSRTHSDWSLLWRNVVPSASVWFCLAKAATAVPPPSGLFGQVDRFDLANPLDCVHLTRRKSRNLVEYCVGETSDIQDVRPGRGLRRAVGRNVDAHQRASGFRRLSVSQARITPVRSAPW